MATELTSAQVAEKLGTDARNLRKFLRSPSNTFEPVGQGKRYAFDPAEFPLLKQLFEAWSKGKPRSTKGAPMGRPKGSGKAVIKDYPLDQDDLMTRTTKSISDRHRAHHIICGFTQKHPVVRDLDFKCKQPTVPGTEYCQQHAQMEWCGGEDEPWPGRCGPADVKVPGLNITVRSSMPYCKYHNGDLSEEEFEELRSQTP